MVFTEGQSQVTDTDRPDTQKRDTTSVSVPVFMLTLLGTLIAVLGLFAAGNIWVVIVGLVAVAFAGVLQVISTRK